MALALKTIDATSTSSLAPAVRLVSDVVVGIVVYALACRALRVPALADAGEIAAAICPRLAPWLTRPVAPDAAPRSTDHA
jgi:hypothetical protein